jgi:peptidoglycan/LPS O-acetylase OafA/YrhL
VIGRVAAFLRRDGFRLPYWAGPSAMAVFVAAVFTGEQTVGWELLGLPIAEVAAAVVILAAGQPSRFASLCALPPLAYLGVASYSLYLWQDFALWVTGWHHPWPALGLAVALTLGSYYGIERRFRRSPAPVQQRELRDIAAATLAAQQSN